VFAKASAYSSRAPSSDVDGSHARATSEDRRFSASGDARGVVEVAGGIRGVDARVRE
jgi:hypothetical protein